MIPGRLYCLTIVILIVSALLSSCAGQQHRANRLEVDITSYLGDNQEYRADDQLSFLISLNETAWLYLYYENADGELFQLIPSPLYPDNFVQPGDFIEFPAEDASFQIEITEPFGSEKVWLLASEEALELSDASFNENLESIDKKLAELKNSLTKELKSNKIRFASDELQFFTAPSD